MSEKKLILMALTPEAEAAIGGEKLVLKHFPFRIGREFRVALVDGAMQVTERRRQNASAPNNDLYLKDQGRLLNVSRQHLQIERDEEGAYRVVDRGSACGTLVGNNHIGGHDQGGECPLQDGEVLVVGTSESPFVFHFVVEE
ncbi:FHA domain-containing protein [Pseudomonadota bacterium]